MPKITTHLWFDQEAKEAAQFYISVFPDSKIKNTAQLNNTPSGSVDIVTIELSGQQFTLISAGPLFKFNPSISFLVACDNLEETEKLWSKLLDGGSILMELGEYPFSKKYGWLQDKYGLSWQIMFTDDHKIKQKITPTLLFVGQAYGKAEEAMQHYISIFPDSNIGGIARYEAIEQPDQAGTIKHASFTLAGQEFFAMDSARSHDFNFNEAISLMVHCLDQAEIDYYWEKLSAVPEAEQCGWLKDKFGVSWQIVPIDMDKFFESSDQAKLDRVTKTFLKMKKFDLETLRKAAE